MNARLLFCLILCNVYIALSAPFTPGNFVISRAGDKVVSSLTTGYVPAFLDEYMKNGTLVQTIDLVCYTQANFNGNPQGGDLQLSQDGTRLTVLCTKAIVNADAYDIISYNATTWRTTTRMQSVSPSLQAYSAVYHANQIFVGFSAGTVMTLPFGLITTGSKVTQINNAEAFSDLQIYGGLMQYVYRGLSTDKILLATSSTSGGLLTPSPIIYNTDLPRNFKLSRYSDTVVYVCQTFGAVTDIRLRKFVKTGSVWAVAATKALYPSLTLFPGGIVTQLENGKPTIYINTVEGLYKLVDTGSSDINPSNLTTVFTISTAHAALLDISLVPSTCYTGVKDGQETDVDCGGGCPKCADGKLCLVDTDCVHNGCNTSTSRCGTCTDSFKNMAETDVDCGGGTCSKCALYKRCLVDRDCSSGVCHSTIFLCVFPTCADQRKNQDETDVDCGGVCRNTYKCANGKSCLINNDCQSLFCNPLLLTCIPCNDGTPCTKDVDCSSGFCNPQTHTCMQPTCNDTFMNQYETDVDCGGTCGATCEDGKNCTLSLDCVSNYCNPVGKCSTPACNDTYLNQNETDLDCGGVCGATCVDGLQCKSDSDCVSNYCNPVGMCSTPACNDTYLNQNETDLDCGGICGATCVDGLQCKRDSDCTSSYCNPNSYCSKPMCPDTWMNNNETDVDCGGSLCKLKCEDNNKCREDNDCLNGFCNINGLCATPTCLDGALNGNETDVDCGGGSCSGCDDGKKCVLESDCLSAKCVQSICVSNRPTTRLILSLGSVSDVTMCFCVILALFNVLFGL